MSIELVLEGQLEKESDREGFSNFLHTLCIDKKLKIEDYDSYVMIDVCPEGAVECSYEGTFVSIAAQSSVAGPGFHAFVAELYDDIMEQGGISLEASDVTNYFFDRNFENLKYQYFYQWLKDIADNVVAHHEEEPDVCVAWPLNYYHPLVKKGYVVTPMGYMAVDDFQEFDMEELAGRFFVWNAQGRDACYYRNCALTLLWKECYFEYSMMNEYTDKMASMIMDYLEAAYDADPLLPLPREAYGVLATALEREHLLMGSIDMGGAQIGYRRDIISYPLGNWSIPADGYAEKSFDEVTQTLHFMAPYAKQDTPWRWMIKANAYVFEKEVPSFLESLNSPAKDVVDHFTFLNDHSEGKGIVEDLKDYYSMVVQVNSASETLFLECIIKEATDIPMMKAWCEGVQHRVRVSDELQS